MRLGNQTIALRLCIRFLCRSRSAGVVALLRPLQLLRHTPHLCENEALPATRTWLRLVQMLHQVV